MRFCALPFLALFIAGLAAPPLRAQFQWSGSWQVSNNGGIYSYSPTDNPTGGLLSGSGQGGFIQQGTGGGSASYTTTYTRSFTVSGSPVNWQILYDRNAFGNTSGLHGIGSASWSGTLDGANLFNYSASNGGGGMSFPFMWNNLGFPSERIVSNGTHTVVITHTLGGNTPGPPFSFPGSFGSGTITSFDFTMTATPVPEPQLLLGALAVAGLAVRKRWLH